jgi:adenylate cyclase
VEAKLFVRTKTNDIELPCTDVVTIGRDTSNTLVLDDTKVSRSHALIRSLGNGKYYLIDLGSANGTIVAGKPVLVPLELKNLDEIWIGDSTIVFQCEPEPNFPQQPALASRAQNPTATLRDDGLTIRETVSITALVVDIHDYTAMSGLLPFNVLGKLVSHWLARMSEVAENNKGVIDKFLGDAVMLRWVTEPEAEVDNTVVIALKAALDAARATEDLNSEFPDLPIRLRIHAGLNHGLATFGTIGGRRGGDYTALGDSVNLAFRLEKTTDGIGADISIGPDAYHQLPNACWTDRLHTVKIAGKREPVEVCGLKFENLAEWFSTQEESATTHFAT